VNGEKGRYPKLLNRSGSWQGEGLRYKEYIINFKRREKRWLRRTGFTKESFLRQELNYSSTSIHLSITIMLVRRLHFSNATENLIVSSFPYGSLSSILSRSNPHPFRLNITVQIAVHRYQASYGRLGIRIYTSENLNPLKNWCIHPYRYVLQIE